MRRAIPLAQCLLLVALALGAAVLAVGGSSSTAAPPHPTSAAPVVTTVTVPSTSSTTTSHLRTTTTTTTAAAPTTTTPPPAPTTAVTTTTAAPTTAPAPVSVTPDTGAGSVTAVGDSVMLDYQDPLQTDIPGVAVYAAVSRQWADGEAVLQQLKASGQLGSKVIVALSTNGPITSTDFNNMMAILSGVTRVVFVNVHVDQPWQDPNNAVLAAGVSQYPNTVLADWASLAAQNPQWFGPDGTHLAINGPGADALAALITQTLESG
jgi:hypothetical protein